MMGLLATGGMAEVYLALSGELTGFRTLVVVKRILPHLAEQADFIRMFFDEARIVALLDHPNIVRIIEVGQDDDEYFLAMEVIQGKPLSALVRKALKSNAPLTQAQAAFLIAQAANGLGHAHDLVDADSVPLNVVHRDVSPQNILVSYEGGVKVIDFGVARAMGRASATCPGGLKGKIQYMAPEQATAGHVDRRSDVFALGVVLWEAICGRRPFGRATDIATLRAIVEESIPPPSRFVNISSRLESIVMRALQRNPAERFQTAQEMALALERYAFASNGFNPAQIATTMKGLFAGDVARWKKTVAVMKNIEGEPDQWVNTSGTYLNPERIDLKTRGSTVALHPVPRPAPSLVVTQEMASDSRSSLPSLDRGLPALPRRAERRLLMGGVTVLGLAALTTVFVVSSRSTWPAGVIRRKLAEGMMASSLAAPVTATRARAPVAAVEPAIQAMKAAASQASVGGEAGAALASPAEDIGEPTLKAPAAAAEAGALPPGPPGAREAAAEDGRSDKRNHHAPTRAVRRTAMRKHTAGRQVLAAPNASVPATRSGDGASGPQCSVLIGTTPWAAVWIDGQDTRRHTPYSDTVACGARRVTFKRTDLGLERTFTVNTIAGQTLKQSFLLVDE